MSSDMILAEAMRLPEEERCTLVVALLNSLHRTPANADPIAIEDAQFAEVQRRWRDIESGKATLVPWEEVEARLLADED